MSKYFAKYLSVEGNIKVGERMMDRITGEIMKAPFDADASKTVTKVQLFLCSRDIQIGDKFNEGDNILNLICTSKDDSGIYSKGKWEEDHHDPAKCLKVIGPISPEAKWVKEGDKFDEEQWRQTDLINSPTIFQIKGPCGYFH